ncbi:MAG: amidohydrolase [Rhodospirillaceae bacterium]|nr:amidohydrolase [Rhodospirillaceae bacterium]
MTGTLISGGTVVTMDRERRIIRDAAVHVESGRITAVGKAADLDSRYPDAERIDAGDMLVIPGLIDGHNHPTHYLSKGLLDDIELKRRWATRLYPFEAAVVGEEAYWGSLGGFAEMIRSGTTCMADPGSFHTAATLEAAKRIGIRAAIAPSMRDIDDYAAPGTNRTPAAIADEADALFQEWHGAEDGRIRIWFGLRTALSVSDEFCRLVVGLAEKRDTGIHTHLAVTASENAGVQQRWGARGVERYRRLGVLGPRLYAAHMGALDESEIELVAKADVRVAHCPSASMLGGFGCISHGRIPELIDAGVTVTLGTDAGAISRFLDMVRVMYLGACAHKDARQDAEAMGAHKAFEMATIDAARALHWDSEIGSIEPGKSADIVLVRTDSLEWLPRKWHNPVANLVYSASGASVDTVMIAGRVVMRNRKLTTIDEDELKANLVAKAESARLRSGIPDEPRWPTH